MKDYSKTRYFNLGKLSIALLEHAVEPIIGERAIGVLQSPLIERELEDKLCDSLMEAENRFKKEYKDTELTNALLDLPIANLDSLRSAVRTFYERPTDTTLLNVLVKQLSTDYPSLQPGRVMEAGQTYLKILREELIPISSDIREKLSSLALFGIQENTGKTQDAIYELIRTVNIQHSHLKSNLGIPTPSYERPVLYSSPSYPLIIDASSVIDYPISDIEKKLGQPISVDAIGIGELSEIPDGGQTRIYRPDKHAFYVNIDKRGIALGLQVVGGLVEYKYGLDDWPIIFSRIGVIVGDKPDVIAQQARRWTDYLGYELWITTDKIDGYVWTVKIHKLRIRK